MQKVLIKYCYNYNSFQLPVNVTENFQSRSFAVEVIYPESYKLNIDELFFAFKSLILGIICQIYLLEYDINLFLYITKECKKLLIKAY